MSERKVSFFSELKRRNMYTVVAFPPGRYLCLVVNDLAFELFPLRVWSADGDRARETDKFCIDAAAYTPLR